MPPGIRRWFTSLVKACRPERSSYNISFDRRGGGRESESERLEREEEEGGGGGRETERWKEKGGRRGGSDVRDDGARSKVSQKSQMSLDLLARQLPETSGIPKMASVGGGGCASLLHLRWQTSSLPATQNL